MRDHAIADCSPRPDTVTSRIETLVDDALYQAVEIREAQSEVLAKLFGAEPPSNGSGAATAKPNPTDFESRITEKLHDLMAVLITNASQAYRLRDRV